MSGRVLPRVMGAKMLLFTVFCCVSGGPFGLEEAVQLSGPGLALCLVLLLPIVWALPDALITAELAAAIPEEGGCVVWVRRALGDFASFVNGWWTWLYSLVDSSMYPVYFASSLAAATKLAFPSLDFTEDKPVQWMIGLAVIVVFAALNIAGTKLVGMTSSAFSILLILPFLVMGLIALVRLGLDPRPFEIQFLAEGRTLTQGLAGGFALVIWNYLGWDQLGTIAEEVKEPERAYPFAMLWGVGIVTLVYVIALLAGLAFQPDPAEWSEGNWTGIALSVGGPALAWGVGLAALISPAALFVASYLGSSRIPFVLAKAGYMPPFMTKLHPKFGTPVMAILVSAGIFSGLSWLTFNELVAINVVLYALALVMEGVSLVALRIREPDLPRPFRIPGGLLFAGLVALLPLIIIGFNVYLEATEMGGMRLIPTGLALLSGPVIWWGVQIARRPK